MKNPPWTAYHEPETHVKELRIVVVVAKDGNQVSLDDPNLTKAPPVTNVIKLFCVAITREFLLKGRICTVDLLVPTSFDQLHDNVLP